MIWYPLQSGRNVKGQGVRAANSQIRFEDTIRSVPFYLITLYPFALEHGQTTEAQLTSELNVGNLKVNTQKAQA